MEQEGAQDILSPGLYFTGKETEAQHRRNFLKVIVFCQLRRGVVTDE